MKVYELWIYDGQVTLVDEDSEGIKNLLPSTAKLVIKFEAISLREAIEKMNSLLKIYKK